MFDTTPNAKVQVSDLSLDHLMMTTLCAMSSYGPCKSHTKDVKFPLSYNTKLEFGVSGGGGTWVAQSGEQPTLAQVMISQFVSLSPTSSSVLTAWSLLWILCPPLSAPPQLCLSLSKINKHLKN